MKMQKMIAAMGLFIGAAAFAKETVPADVRAFVRNAETCQHFAGEWDNDLAPARKRRIERSVDKYCFAAQQQLKQVAAKYRHDAMLRHLIAQHRYDAVVSYSKLASE